MSPLLEPEGLPQLPKYEILEELGHGGMATVYRARDHRLQREVAIKVIHKHLRESTEVAARFDAEARAVAKLRHPNIVEVYDVSAEDEPDKYIVVELSRGVTLRRALAQFREMPPEVAASLGIELASALAHAHAAGVIHRDLKPENVLIETVGDVRVKLTDFGIAKILDAQGVTSTGQVLGSPAHMAPEQIEGGEVDARADVFGLGVLLYECMVGHLPFEGNNPAQVLRRVLEGSYACADRERPTVGARWAKILGRALAKDAADRYPTAPELLAAMQAELASLTITDPRAELRDFFLDAEGYRARHAERLIPVLTQRGEQARKAGDLHSAAADFNRALAYAPQDPELLKLIGRLQRGRATRRVLMTVLSVAAGSAVVGTLGMAIQRWVTKESPIRVAETPRPEPSAPRLAESAASAPVANPTTAAPATVVRTVPTERPARHPVEAGSAASREVSFVVNPKAALVSIDNGPPEDLFMKPPKKLSVGWHTFGAHVAAPSKCCEELVRKEEIKGDDGSGPQKVSLSLKFRDAKISAEEAPEGTQLRCPMLRNVVGPASEVFSVKMSTLTEEVSCILESPVSAQQSSVTLRAGELTKVQWTAQ